VSLFLSRRWRQQPRTPVQINYGGPLAVGLEIALVPATTVLVDSSAEPIVFSTIRSGSARLFSKSAQALQSFVLPRSISSNNWTLLQEVSPTPDGAAFSATGGIFSSSTERIHIHYKAYPTNAVGVDARPYFADANSDQTLPTSGERLILGTTINSSRLQLSTYVNGSLAAGTKTTVSTSAISVNSIELFRKQFGGGGSDLMAAGSTSAFFFVWSRALSDAEMRAASENPWQIFKPQQTVFYSLPSGSLFSAIDETVSDRADYIKSTAAGQVYETTLSPIQQPTGNIDINFDADSPLNTGGIKFEVFDGTNLIKSQTVSFPSATSTFSITPSEYSAIDTPRVGRFLPQRWRKQPQGNIDIDWNNPLTNGLFLAMAPGISAKSFYRFPTNDPNWATGNIGPLLTYINSRFRATPFGAGAGNVYFQNREGANASYSLNNVGSGGSPVYTYGVAYCQLDTPDAQISGFSYTNSTTEFSLQATSTATQFVARNWTANVDTSANTHIIAVPGGVPNQKQLTASVTWVTGQPGRIYNGKQLLVSSNSTVWDGGWPNYNFSYFNSFTSGKTVGLLGVTWLRALTDNDRAAFDENPWQLFRPNPGRLYGLAPAGGWPWSPTLRVTSL